MDISHHNVKWGISIILNIFLSDLNPVVYFFNKSRERDKVLPFIHQLLCFCRITRIGCLRARAAISFSEGCLTSSIFSGLAVTSGVVMPDFLPHCDTRVGHILAMSCIYLETDAS